MIELPDGPLEGLLDSAYEKLNAHQIYDILFPDKPVPPDQKNPTRGTGKEEGEEEGEEKEGEREGEGEGKGEESKGEGGKGTFSIGDIVMTPDGIGKINRITPNGEYEVELIK
jgi:hypothetical protein